jgi:predicted dehydrogenase
VTWRNYKDCYQIADKDVKLPQNEGLIEHFVDCIEGRTQPTCGGEQQLHVHEILFKGYEAARTGQVQNLETTFKPWHKIDPAFHDTRSRPV